MPARRRRHGSAPAGSGEAPVLESSPVLESNSAIADQLRQPPGQADAGPTLGAAGDRADLADFPGYEQPWHSTHDQLIADTVAAFNLSRGLAPGDPNHLDPNLVKAWALQESGGHEDIFTSGDLMQVNNGGDWVPEKANFGLQRDVAPDPGQSLSAALEWAWYKGETTRAMPGGTASEGWHPTQRGTVAVPGYESQFTSWDTAIDRYNGGGVPNYVEEIRARYESGRGPR